MLTLAFDLEINFAEALQQHAQNELATILFAAHLACREHSNSHSK